MKKLIIFFFLFSSLVSNAQTITETVKLFWDAVDSNKTNLVIENGERLLKYIEEKNLKFDSTIVTIRLQLGSAYQYQGNYVKSLILNESTYEQSKKNLGETSESTLYAMNNLAYSYSMNGYYNKSEIMNKQCLDLIDKTLGKDHELYSTCLNNLALDYSNLHNFLKSIELNQICLNIEEKLHGNESDDYYHTLSNLAGNYFDLGENIKSKELNEKCLNHFEILYGKNNLHYSFILRSLSLNNFQLGDFSKSKEQINECINIQEVLLGKENTQYLKSLDFLCNIYHVLGDYESSKNIHTEILSIQEKILGKKNIYYSMSLQDLASDYLRLGNQVLSKKLIDESLSILKKLFGRNHESYLLGLSYQVLIYSYNGNHNKAIKLIKESLNSRNSQTSISYITSMQNLSLEYFVIEKYRFSKNILEKSLDTIEKSYGKMSHDYVQSLGLLARDYFLLNDLIQANKCLDQNLNLDFKIYKKFALNSQMKSVYQNLLFQTFFVYSNSLFQSFNLSNEIHNFYNYWINLNGIIGSDQDQLAENIALSSDSTIINLFDDLKISKLQLGKWNEMTIQDRIAKGINTESLENEIERLESELSRKSKDFANSKKEFGISDVKSNLNQDEVFIDLIRLPGYDFKTNLWNDSVKYLVFIIDASIDTVPKFILIDEGQELEGEIYSEYSKNTVRLNVENSEIDKVSYKHFWEPIADKIGGYKTVYVSLGGVYNNINLNTLFNTETGKYLFEEKDIRIVSNARDFVLSKEEEMNLFTNNTASLFGFPNYDGNTTTSIDTIDQLAYSRDLDPFWIDSLSRGGMKASLLPGTKIEVENISTTFESKGWDVSTFLKDDATESSVKQVTSPRVMHIATHGYFFEDIPQDNADDRFMGMDKQKMVQDPLLRSGLLFAGANKTLQGEKMEGENGLLSAYEASMLNLKETELVVLSACETGRGEVKNGEGVYGLRKAFSDAGAQNIIMSLWKVDDKVTQEFMTRFYEIWLNEKTTIREAFNKTQLEIKAKYPQPYYWGAFILVGE